MHLTPYSVSVRALCEFAAKRGDLDRRFSPSPTAQEGLTGHRTVAAKRSGSYRSEVTLSLVHRGLMVRGRADGYDADAGLVEEVKTFRGDLARMPANKRALHRAQANAYAWMLCHRDGLDGLSIALVYYDVDHEVEMPALVERRSSAELRSDFEALCDAFLGWAQSEQAHRAKRDAGLGGLRFPHPDFRAGQHAMAAAVWRAVTQRRCLVAEAPTGIGKTVATLFPALKAMGSGEVDRLFFLTARTTGRQLALSVVASIRRANVGVPLRVLELSARDKACEYPDRACHGESCPLARGFYDRLPVAREAAREAGFLDRAIRTTALAHDVCPHWLAVEMTRWCDLVIGDYNHWFDGYPLLAALTEDHEWRTVVLVDEAHNLPDRARSMFSAHIASSLLDAAEDCGGPALKKPMTRFARAWARTTEAMTESYTASDALPQSFFDALNALTTAIGIEASASDGDANALPPALLEFYWAALELERLATTFAGHSVFDVSVNGAGSTIGIRNLDPAPFLKPRHASSRATVLFSATLTPHAFYADLLGLPADTVRVDVPTPFAADQLTVRIVRDIPTRLHQREHSMAAFAELIGRQYEEAPGNYLVFVSSHAYLERLADVFRSSHAAVPSWRQARRMTERERDDFLACFAPSGKGIGFAVLGGVFAEGIDLPGDRLIGAFVATLGLPSFDDINETRRQRLEARYGSGYEYAYLYPGVRRVVQAAGRVIRSTSDRGTLHLVDDRFHRREVMALLPPWWNLPGRIASSPGTVDR